MSDLFGFQQTEIGRGFSVDSLEQMRRFFIEYKGQIPAGEISETGAMFCWDTTKHENRHFYTSGCLGEASLPRTDRSLGGRDGSPSRPLDFENGSPSRPFFGTVSRKSLPQSKEAVIEHSEPAKSGQQYKQICPTASAESLPSISPDIVDQLPQLLPMDWSHYTTLLTRTLPATQRFFTTKHAKGHENERQDFGF